MSDKPDRDDPLAELLAAHWQPPACTPDDLSLGLARRKRRRNRRDTVAVLGLTALAFFFAYFDPAGIYDGPTQTASAMEQTTASADWVDVAVLDSDELSADRQLWIAMLGGTP